MVKRNTISETQFEKAVVDVAHMFGWKVASFRNSMSAAGSHLTAVKYDGKGYVDLSMFHPCGEIVLAEIKAEKGRLSPAQKQWGETLTECSNVNDISGPPIKDDFYLGMRYVVWRPSDGDDIISYLSFGKTRTWTP